MGASDKQVGGDHYKGKGKCLHCGGAVDHWDLVEMFGLDPFQYVISKYLFRWRDKAGLQDIDKMAHFVERYRELAVRELNGETDSLEEEAEQELIGLARMFEEAGFKVHVLNGDDLGVPIMDEPETGPEPGLRSEPPLPPHILALALAAGLEALRRSAEAEPEDRGEEGGPGPGYVAQDPDLKPPRSGEEEASEDLGADSVPCLEQCERCGRRVCRCGDGYLSSS